MKQNPYTPTTFSDLDLLERQTRFRPWHAFLASLLANIVLMPPFLAWPAFQEGIGFTLICIVDFAGIALLFVIGLPVWAESSFSPADAWNIFVVAGGGVAFWTLLAATIQHYLMRPQLVPVCGYCGRRSPENMPICPRCTNRV